MPVLRAQANEAVLLEVRCDQEYPDAVTQAHVSVFAASAATGAVFQLECQAAMDAGVRKRVLLCQLASASVDEIVVVALPAPSAEMPISLSLEALKAQLAAVATTPSPSSSSTSSSPASPSSPASSSLVLPLLLLRVSSGGASAAASTVLIDDASPLTHVPAGSAGALAVLLRDSVGNAACGGGRPAAAPPQQAEAHAQAQVHRLVDVLLVPVSWPGDAATALAAAIPASAAQDAPDCSADALLPLRAKVDVTAVHRGRCGALPVEFVPQCPGWWSVLATVADDEGRLAGSIPVIALPAEDPLLQAAFTAGRDRAATAFGSFWPAHVYVSNSSVTTPRTSSANAECPRVAASAHPLADVNRSDFAGAMPVRDDSDNFQALAGFGATYAFSP